MVMSGSVRPWPVVAFEGELNAIVKEYLEFGGYEQAQQTFVEECQQKSKPICEISAELVLDDQKKATQKNVLEYFDLGKRKDFLREWNTNIPQDIRSTDMVAKKLEFTLWIHFAVYPMRHKLPTKDSEQAMATFKNFLETQGAELSQTPAFLPYYALPFVQNPTSHPSYKELFKPSWVEDLRNRFQQFWLLSTKADQPQLFQLYRGSPAQTEELREQLHEAREKLNLSNTELHRYMKSNAKLQGDYHDLIGISADLVDALEETALGNTVSPEMLQQICKRLFTHAKQPSIDFNRPGTAGKALRTSIIDVPSKIKGDTPLDFPKVKSDLLSANNHRKSLLLQALRWRLTRTNTQQRTINITSYVHSDLLGCAAASGPYKDIIPKILNSEVADLTGAMSRLINTISSVSVGRSYLARNPGLMASLIDNMKAEQCNSLTRGMILGTLQKLSLRRNFQSLMINVDLVEWLISLLEEYDLVSDYTLEYAVALLMNLCFRTAGKKRCANNPTTALKVLTDLLGLGNDYQEILPYVNGVLYSILAIPSVREAAKDMGIEEIVEGFIKEGHSARELEYIIKQLNSDQTFNDRDSEDEEEDDEEDEEDLEMEPDLDKDDEVKPGNSERLAGEELLSTEYLLRKKPQDHIMGRQQPLQRPVTPSQMKNTDISPTKTNNDRVPNYTVIEPINETLERPPTRSGSQPPPTASTAISRENNTPSPTGSSKSTTSKKSKTQDAESIAEGGNYSKAFMSRPRILRTPVEGSSNSLSRNTQNRSPPTPKYSDSVPRPTSASKSGKLNGSKTHLFHI
uniref:LisH domain-containing protein ARMC9 n=1 Tax=Octopus bimaculoides TaxID=37653 RepID=A0A0L8HIW6_OCTBM